MTRMPPRLHPLRIRPPENAEIDVRLEWKRPASTTVAADDATTVSGLTAAPSELMTYWAAQQARIGGHETARYGFSAFVVAGSLVALSKIGEGQMLAGGRWLAAASVLLVNLLAVVFTLSELRWIKIHQTRAKAVLSAVLPEVVGLQKSASLRWYSRTDSDANGVRFTSSLALQIIHWIIAGVALVMAAVVK
ncbi:hypothetical protein AAII07_37465 [Microvirga sp. 0TCS3.31]